jgi:hypothetical protein
MSITLAGSKIVIYTQLRAVKVAKSKNCRTMECAKFIASFCVSGVMLLRTRNYCLGYALLSVEEISLTYYSITLQSKHASGCRGNFVRRVSR